MHAQDFRERLWAPASFWLIGMFFGLSFVVALGFYFGPLAAVAVFVVTTALIAAALLWYGSLQIRVTAAGLHVADMQVAWEFVGRCAVHDRAATRHRLGAGADARAVLAVRPYVAESVEVPIVDPDDPHPYWLVSSRRAQHLAAAINAHASAGLGTEPGARQDEDVPTKE